MVEKNSMHETLLEAKADVAADLRRLADDYRFSGRIFHVALVERFLKGVPTVALEPETDTTGKDGSVGDATNPRPQG